MTINSRPIVYYHVLCYGDWKKLFQEQLLKMYASGLLANSRGIRVFLTRWNEEDREWVLDQLSGVHNVTLVLHSSDVWAMEERATLLYMHREAKHFNEDVPILYIHTKGLTRGGYNVDTWRMFMEHYNVTLWKQAILAMSKGKLAYGVNLRDDTVEYFGSRFLHYSGNIWWSRSSFVKELDPSFISDTENRWHAEFWIGTKGSFDAFHCALESGVDHYHFPFEVGKYIKTNSEIL